jgi:chorismate mutase
MGGHNRGATTVSDPDLETIAEACQSILGTVQTEDVSPQTLIVVETRLQTIWAEVNDEVDSLEDIEEIYPDK